SIVLGNVELNDREVILSVNSQVRAEKGQTYFAQRLGPLVRHPLTEMQSLDQVKSDTTGPKSLPPDLSPEEQRAVVHESLDRHYREVLDQPIPMLGNKSPRSAAKSAAGRAKVVAWLKTLENHSSKFKDPDSPLATYDFAWLWRELNLSELRR